MGTSKREGRNGGGTGEAKVGGVVPVEMDLNLAGYFI